MNELVFRRVEQKYLLSKRQMNMLLKEIDKYIVKDEHFESTICNIYFDNEHNDIINNSIEKPKFKEKVRVRSYGIPDDNSLIFFELKDKYKGIVGKRRVTLTLKEFYDYTDKGILKDDQIMREIDYIYKMYDLKPYVFVAYDRKSYCGITDAHLRITFDANLRYRFSDLRLESGDKGKPYFDDNQYIMEIKTLDAMPMWLAHSLSKLQIYPTSFSKVGNVYIKSKGSVLSC